MRRGGNRVLFGGFRSRKQKCGEAWAKAVKEHAPQGARIGMCLAQASPLGAEA